MISDPCPRSIARRLLCRVLLLPLILGASQIAHAGIDHEIALDQSGIWARKYQTGLEFAVIATEIGGSLWLGNDDELGHTLWQTVDSTAISSIAAEALKFTFSQQSESMVQRAMLRQLSERRGDAAGQFRHAFHCKLCARLSVDMVVGIAARLRRPRAIEEPGALANRRHCRMGIGIRRRLLGDHAQHTALGADFAARLVGRLLQEILRRSDDSHPLCGSFVSPPRQPVTGR